MRWIFCVLILCTCIPNITFASDSQHYGFFSDINLGYEDNIWKINDDSENHVLEYKTEGLQAAKVRGSLGYGSKAFFDVSYETPIVRSEKQNEMLSTNTSESKLIAEKFLGVVRLDPLVDYLIPGDSLSGKVLQRLLSVRYKYTRELFFVDATALTSAVLIPKTAVLDYTNRTVSGSSPLLKGEKVTARTEFVDNEISIALWSFDMPIKMGQVVKLSPHEFRVGQYFSQWRRPSDTTLFTINNQPVVYDAEYKTNGILISIETMDPGSPGINADFSFRFGYDNHLNTAIDWGKVANKKVDTSSVMFNLALWYNFYFGATRDDGLYLTLGGNVSERTMNVDIVTETATSVDTTRIIHDTDTLYKLYATLGYRF